MNLSAEDILRSFYNYSQMKLDLPIVIKGLISKKFGRISNLGDYFLAKLKTHAGDENLLFNWKFLLKEEERNNFAGFCDSLLEANVLNSSELKEILNGEESRKILEGITTVNLLVHQNLTTEKELEKLNEEDPDYFAKSYHVLQVMLRRRVINTDQLLDIRAKVQNQINILLDKNPVQLLQQDLLLEDSESNTIGDESETAPTKSHIPQPKQFGPYEVIEEIARGGMGVVYKVRHIKLDHIYALKVLIAGESASETALARFFREARAVAKLKHPGIVQIHEFGEEKGIHYFSMDYVEGISLGKINALKKPTIREIVTYIRDTANVLQYAHSQGVLHRDLKPENILIDEENQPKLLDFGLAIELDKNSQRLTQEGATMGTPAYMPPEQVMGNLKKVDCSSDVYSLGACFYEVTTGKSAFRGKSYHQIFYQILNEEPVPPEKLVPGLHRDINTIILKCLEKEQSSRYQTSQELEEDLTCFLNGLPIKANPATRWENYWRWIKRNKVITVLISFVFMLVLGMLVVFTTSQIQQHRNIKRWAISAQHALDSQNFELALKETSRIFTLDEDNPKALLLNEKIREKRADYEIEEKRKINYQEGLHALEKAQDLRVQYKAKLKYAQEKEDSVRQEKDKIKGWETWAEQYLRYERQKEAQVALKERIKHFIRCENEIEKGLKASESAGERAEDISRQLLELDVAIQFDEWAEASRTGDEIKAAFHLAKYEKRIHLLPELKNYYQKKFLGDGVLQIEDSTPSGAKVWIFRYIEENRIPEIELDANTPAGIIEVFRTRGGPRKIPLPFNFASRTCRVPLVYYESVDHFWEFDKESPKNSLSSEVIQTNGGSLTKEEYLKRRDGTAYPLYFEKDDFNLLGTTPLKFNAFPHGSYLLIYELPGKAKSWKGRTFSYQKGRVPLYIPREGKIYLQSIKLLLSCEIPQGMIFIPDIPYINGGDPEAHGAQKLNHRKRIPDYFCSKYEETFKNYYQFLTATEMQVFLKEQQTKSREEISLIPRSSSSYLYGLSPSSLAWKKDYPEANPMLEAVRGVSYQDITVYLKWLNKLAQQEESQFKEELTQQEELATNWREKYPHVILTPEEKELTPVAVTYRLARSFEWEKGIRGTDGRFFPWGNTMIWKYTCGGNTHKGLRRIDPIGWYPYDESPWGIRDLPGGVYEWGGDFPATKSGDDVRNIPGGAFNDSYSTSFRGAANDFFDPSDADITHGFRLYADYPPK